MKKEYDFSKAIKNPYVDKQLKKQISMNILKIWQIKKAYRTKRSSIFF